MHTKNLQDALKRRPFEPFAVVMSSGDKYVVRHPENAMLLKQGLVIGYDDREGRDELPERFIVASFLHISALEPIAEKRRRRAS